MMSLLEGVTGCLAIKKHKISELSTIEPPQYKDIHLYRTVATASTSNASQVAVSMMIHYCYVLGTLSIRVMAVSDTGQLPFHTYTRININHFCLNLFVNFRHCFFLF